jgi:hypothetical protein
MFYGFPVSGSGISSVVDDHSPEGRCRSEVSAVAFRTQGRRLLFTRTF